MAKLLWVSVVCLIVLCGVHCGQIEYDTVVDDTKDYAVDKSVGWLWSFAIAMVNLFAPNKPKYVRDAIIIKCYNKYYKDGVRVSHDLTDFKNLFNSSPKLAILINKDEDAGKWLHPTAKDYVAFHEINVCTVIWNPLRYIDGYNDGSAPNLIYNFLENIQKNTSLKFEEMTLVGLGVGANIVASIASKVKQNPRHIGDIFALNPPKRNKDQLQTSIDKSDARYVQVISTTRDDMYTDYEMAHQIFIPNLGKSPQLPCIYRDAIDDIKLDLDKCSEDIVIEYFRRSLNPDNEFLAQKCDNGYAYLLRQCENKFDRMGVMAEGSFDGRFYLDTFGGPPYVYLDHRANYANLDQEDDEEEEEEKDEKETSVEEEQDDEDEDESEEMEKKKKKESSSEEDDDSDGFSFLGGDSDDDDDEKEKKKKNEDSKEEEDKKKKNKKEEDDEENKKDEDGKKKKKKDKKDEDDEENKEKEDGKKKKGKKGKKNKGKKNDNKNKQDEEEKDPENMTQEEKEKKKQNKKQNKKENKNDEETDGEHKKKKNNKKQEDHKEHEHKKKHKKHKKP